MSDQTSPLVDLFPHPFRYPHDIRDVRYCDERAFGPAGTIVTPDSMIGKTAKRYTAWGHEELYNKLAAQTPEARRSAYFFRIDEHGKQVPGSTRRISFDQLNHIIALDYGVVNTAPLLISIETKLESEGPDWKTCVVADIFAVECALTAFLHANPRRSTPDFYPAEGRIREALDRRGIYRTQFREPRGTHFMGRDITVEYCDAPLTNPFYVSLFAI